MIPVLKGDKVISYKFNTQTQVLKFRQEYKEKYDFPSKYNWDGMYFVQEVEDKPKFKKVVY